MNPPGYSARRATLDDLPALLALWQTEKLDVAVLEKHFTEFQVALDERGHVLGALGLAVAGTAGRLHSECFSDFGLTDKLRPLLWERVQAVARNRGVARLWLHEDTLYFRGEGFDPASPELIEKLPAAFGSRDDAWWTLKLKEDLLAGMTPEQELALFKKLTDDSTARVLRQAQVMKWIAGVVAVAVFIAILATGFLMWRIHKSQRRFGQPPMYNPGR